MKFVYVDESGNSNEDRFLTFFGVQIDVYRLKASLRAVRPLLQDVANAFPEDLQELKTSKMVNGRGGWRNVEPEVRKDLFRRLCAYPRSVSARAYAYIVDRQKYAAAHDQCPDWASTAWMTGAIAVAAFAQRLNQKQLKNKGLTVLVFDDNKAELPKLSSFLVDSCPAVDEYYGRSANAEPFDHIVDTAFAIKSEQSDLVQVSDACAYAIRRKAELELGKDSEEWDGELELVRGACAAFGSRVDFPTGTWVANPHCKCARWIRDLGHPELKKWVTR
jgi:hypothetical protein